MLTDKEEVELLKLLEEEAAINDRRNPVFSVVRKFKGRNVVMIGGSGSGKSYEIADRVEERALEADDARILCVRAEQKQVAKSQFPLLWSRTPFHKVFERTKAQGNERIFNGDKGEIIFSGLDDVDKLKSIFDITSVWIEEGDQVLAADVRELNRRLRGYHGLMQIYITFNPVSSLNYINKMYFSDRIKKVVTRDSEGNKKTVMIDRTLTIRGQKEFENFPYYKDNPITDEMLEKTITVWDPEAKDGLGDWMIEMYYTTLLVHSTYRDNKFIDSAYRQVMRELRENDPDEADVYCDGQWGVTGGTFFDKAKVNRRIKNTIPPLDQGEFEFEYKNHLIIDSSIKWVSDPNGPIKIYSHPKKGYPYVLSGDTAGEGSDWNIGYMTDNTNEKDVATLRINYDEDLYARQMYCFGKWYGELNECYYENFYDSKPNDEQGRYINALAGIETNFSTHPQKELERLGYDHFFIRKQSEDSFTSKMAKKFGFNTNKATRPDMLGKLKTFVREESYKLLDLDLLLEMTTFIKNEKGRPEAAKGMHDDMIMSRAINIAIRWQQHETVSLKKIKHSLPIALRDDVDEYVDKVNF